MLWRMWPGCGELRFVMIYSEMATDAFCCASRKMSRGQKVATSFGRTLLSRRLIFMSAAATRAMTPLCRRLIVYESGSHCVG